MYRTHVEHELPNVEPVISKIFDVLLTNDIKIKYVNEQIKISAIK